MQIELNDEQAKIIGMCLEYFEEEHSTDGDIIEDDTYTVHTTQSFAPFQFKAAVLEGLQEIFPFNHG